MRSTLTALLLACTACGTDSLQALDSPGLVVQETPEGRLVLYVSSKHALAVCPTLGANVSATASGRALTVASRGGPAANSNCLARDCRCDTPSFALDPPPGVQEDSTELLVRDDSTVFSTTIRALWVPRSITVSVAGKEVAVAGSVATDTLALQRLQFTTADGGSFIREDGFPGARTSGASVSVTVPDGGGTGSLEVDANALAQVDRCEGATRCAATFRAKTSAQVTFAP